MENGNDRRDQAEKHLKDTLEKSKEMIENWHQPTKTRGFWRRDLNQGTYVTSQEPQLRGGSGGEPIGDESFIPVGVLLGTGLLGGLWRTTLTITLCIFRIEHY